MSKIWQAGAAFLKEGVRNDWRLLRTRLVLFVFNSIPDFYLLMPLRNMILRCGGARVPLFGCYIRSPFVCVNLKNLQIGSGVFINKYAYIEGNGPVQIGNACQIGPWLKIENTNHIVSEGMRTEMFPVIVEDGVWIASGVILLPNSRVRSGSVIAAGAVVVGATEAGGLYGGVPAKRIEKRRATHADH
jgi:acetyltransferase-like isoleucine patch superfamily enzyme